RAGPPEAPPERSAPPPWESVDPAVARLGERVFQDAGCFRCHALGSSGNPRSPLDGVGARLTRAEIHAHIVAAPSVRPGLSRSVIRAKEGFAGLSDQELDALAAYLTTQRGR
ncbi:MAG: cytochrome c, partial [Longimicrobiales bacterium]|nr:cytochrome c [Longimicrobiales bacterium]